MYKGDAYEYAGAVRRYEYLVATQQWQQFLFAVEGGFAPALGSWRWLGPPGKTARGFENIHAFAPPCVYIISFNSVFLHHRDR